jgi:tetratricopeptide (TPR) repeat protein
MEVMKQIWVTTILIWLLIVGILRLYPLSRGDKYFAKLQKWYWALENSQWEKAKTMEKDLNKEDTAAFAKENENGELQRRLAQSKSKLNKTADDWAEISVILYKLGQYQESAEAAAAAYEIDPIREDVSRLYFSSRAFLQNP